VLTTDLKPEVRAEAIKALCAFGANGYGPEAARAIVELMRHYDFKQTDGDDEKVVQAAINGLGKVRADAEPILVEELKKGGTNGRWFALVALDGFGTRGKAAVPAVVERLRDEDRDVRRRAVRTLHDIDEDGVSARALAAVVANEPELRYEAVQALAYFGPKARPALPELVQAARDFPEVRSFALQALGQIKPDARTVLPALAASLADRNQNVRLKALEHLQELGPDAREAVTPLMEALKAARDPGEQVRIIAVLAGLGPAAKEALPLLLAITRGNPFNTELSKAVRNAVERIDK
jgi:hypothetical protein